MKNAQEAVQKLLPLLYQAPGDEAAWTHFIAALTDAVGATQGLFVHHNTLACHTSLASCFNLDEQFADAYEQYFQFINPYFNVHPTKLPKSGTLGLLNELIPDKEVEHTEFFNDHVIPQELTVRNAIRITAQETENLHTSIALHYPRQRYDANPDYAMTLCRLMLPHIQTALQLHTKMGLLESRLNYLTGVLNNTPQGIILLDKSGKFVQINEPARHIIEAHDGLHIRNNTLQTTLPRETKALTTLINAVAKTALGKATTPGRSFHVLRPSGKHPFELLVAPVYEQLDIKSCQDSATAIFINDPEHANDSLGNRLQQRYQLTKAETAITLFLIQGRETKEILELLGIQRETLKTHLKNIFQKTHTHRQTELISVILRTHALLQGCHG